MEERDIHDLVTKADDDRGPNIVQAGLDTHNGGREQQQAGPKDINTPPLAALLQQWIDRALHFCSHASNETLGACFIGLGASTYLILGRVGLVLIGVVGGIALHATWEGTSAVPGQPREGIEREARKRRELGLEVVRRVWEWRDERTGKTGEGADGEEPTDVDVKLYQGRALGYSDFRPETAAALDTFTTAVIRDYVNWWYAPVLPGEETFPAACRQTVRRQLLRARSRRLRV